MQETKHTWSWQEYHSTKHCFCNYFSCGIPSLIISPRVLKTEPKISFVGFLLFCFWILFVHTVTLPCPIDPRKEMEWNSWLLDCKTICSEFDERRASEFNSTSRLLRVSHIDVSRENSKSFFSFFSYMSHQISQAVFLRKFHPPISASFRPHENKSSSPQRWWIGEDIPTTFHREENICFTIHQTSG